MFRSSPKSGHRPFSLASGLSESLDRVPTIRPPQAVAPESAPAVISESARAVPATISKLGPVPDRGSLPIKRDSGV